MEWISSVARDAVSSSLILVAVAALFVCWKTRSLHPINMRLLRLVLPTGQIQCKIVDETLSNQSSLIKFRMAHGVHCRTLQDAQNLAKFATDRNLPLELVGMSGDKFDARELKLKYERERARAWFLLPGGTVSVCALLASAFLYIALNSSLLISLKETDNWYWLGPTEATALGRDAEGERVKFASSRCTDEARVDATKKNETNRDLAILCDVWAASGLSEYLADELPKQKYAFLFLTILISSLGLVVYFEMRTWFAESELRKLLNGARKNAVPGAKAATA